MKKLKKAMELIQYNLWTLAGFEVFFKLLSFLLFTPLFVQIFNFTMKITGYPYLTLDNVFFFFINPITIFFVFLLILFMTFYTMFDITTVLLILDQSQQKKKVRIRDVLKPSFLKCCNVFKLRNLPLAFLILFLIPFLNLGVTSSFITAIKIPEFITDFFVKNQLLFCLATVVFLFLTCLLFTWIYALPYFVFEDMDFFEARKRSKELSKGSRLKDGFYLWGIQLGLFLFYFLFIIAGILLIFLFNGILGEHLLLKSVTTSIIGSFLLFSFFLLSFLGVPISYAGISLLFYTHKRDKKEKIVHSSIAIQEESIKEHRKVRRLAITAFALLMVGSTYLTYGIYKGHFRLSIVIDKQIEITAHRGASFQYPENTMLAFQGAKELGADWIELDVQQTKDGKIVVLHDKSFKRTTGVNKKTWEVTYEEIKDLDAGSFKDEKFKDARIPLLDSVIVWAKENNMKLNIELKPTGHEVAFEKSVVDIVKKHGFQDHCVFASQTYSVLEQVKRYDETMKTLYVMSFVYGDLSSLKAADSFSIEARSITASLVNRVHEEGKKIHAWTINTQETMQQMINLKVDNLITDNIILAKELLSTN